MIARQLETFAQVRHRQRIPPDRIRIETDHSSKNLRQGGRGGCCRASSMKGLVEILVHLGEPSLHVKLIFYSANSQVVE